MSTFRVTVETIRAIESIKKADRIELAVVGGYRSVVKKGEFKAGDLAVYLPEASILPEWLIKDRDLWLEAEGKGKLGGENGDRIVPMTMRGALSQGILYPVHMETTRSGAAVPFVLVGPERRPHFVEPGEDLAAVLGVVKYKPVLPAELLGSCMEAFDHVARFDVEDVKRYPEVLQPGEPVAATETIHGLCGIMGVVPGLRLDGFFFGGDSYVTSKGMGHDGYAFMDVPENDGNPYVKVMRAHEAPMAALRAEAEALGVPVHVCGEIYGPGTRQHLRYGRTDLGLKLFAVYVGVRGHGRWMDYDEYRAFAARLGFDVVDELYKGPYSEEAIVKVRDGKTVTGNGAHIREGVVVVPLTERRDDGIGRVVLKAVSPAYLGDADATDFT